MNVSSSRQEITDLFCKLYIEDDMSVNQIAEITHYSVYTIRSYLSQAGCKKRKYNKNQNKNKEQPDKIKQQEKDSVEVYKSEDNVEKPYEPLYDNYVLYKGRVWKKLTGEELKQLLIKEQEKRYGEKSLASKGKKTRKRSISK